MFDSVCELFCKTIRNIVEFGCYFVVECYGGALLDRPCMVFQRMCVLCLRSKCAFRRSFHRFCLCVCMSEVISSLRSLRAGSQVFAPLMMFLCVMLHTMWWSKILQLVCILTFGILCLSAIGIMFLKIILAVYVGGYCGLSERCVR